MKILKKLAVAIFLFFILGVLLFLYLNYKSEGTSLLSAQKIFNIKRSSKEENTAFSDYTVSYVEDPDLGAVTGIAEMSPTAREFREWLDKGWAPSKNSDETTPETYIRYYIVRISESSVEARMFESAEIKTLSLKCLPENTALFKSMSYVEFISANFEVGAEIKQGDSLYTKCISEVCDSVGPECIIIRKPGS